MKIKTRWLIEDLRRGIGSLRPLDTTEGYPTRNSGRPSNNLFAPLSQEWASRPSVPYTQTNIQEVRKVLREMPWMADYITDTGLAAVLLLGLHGAQDTPPSWIPGFGDECRVSPAVAPIDSQVQTTPVRATDQAARTIDPAAALRTEHDGVQDSPPTSLLVIHDKRPASPAVAPIDAQVHTTSVTATEQAAHTTEQPPTTLPAPTEPAAPVIPPAPRASSTSSLSSAPNNTKSPSPQPHRTTRPRAGRKEFGIS